MSRAVNVIKAVHDVDWERVLRRLGLYEKLARGELGCAVCGCPLSLENFDGLYKEDGGVKLVCTRIDCLAEAARRVSLARQSTRK
ncbi:MAG: hypothetical protein GSR85_01655 [Desulfurococcales archaeon]|nr:hypothetical protein [Desulfurococcales archaeon]